MSLRERVLRGGFYLGLRQILSIVIGLGGTILLIRLIGPANYGLYSGSFAIITFVASVAQMGVNVYLVRARQEEALAEVAYHQAFSFLLLSGLCISGLGLSASHVLVLWMEDPRFLGPLQVLMLTVPLTVLSKPPIARLEQALDYRKVAGLELTGQLLFNALALVLAWKNLGVWAPVAGYGLWQAWTMGASYGLARYRPRWHWSPKLLREMLSYGLGYSASLWVFQLRNLVNPLVVGRYLGAEAVGYVALAIRLVTVLGFMSKAAWRLAIPALAKVQQDLPRLRRAMEEAMGLQLLAQGPLLAGLALLGPWLLPLMFGDRWDSVLLVYPFIALGSLVNAVFNMHSSVLYVLQRNWAVTTFHVVHIALFAGAAFLLVPRLGVMGYGLAEVVALVSYPIIHCYVALLFAFDYGRALPWLVAFIPPLSFPLVGFPWGLGLLAFTLVPVLSAGARTQVREYWLYARRKLA
jgi:O-antigen/teichoic acid export membrane protein